MLIVLYHSRQTFVQHVAAALWWLSLGRSSAASVNRVNLIELSLNHIETRFYCILVHNDELYKYLVQVKVLKMTWLNLDVYTALGCTAVFYNSTIKTFSLT